jgi:predicted phage-related endonuclease
MNNFTFIPNDEHFKKIRQTTVGASDIPIICGLSKYKTPHQLWLEKTGRTEGFQGNSVTEWGHLHEGNILYRYIKEITEAELIADIFLLDYIKHNKKRPKKWKPDTVYFPYTEFIHPEIKFAMAHPDCIDTIGKINIEAKSHKLFIYDYKEIPLPEYLQIQWQLLCTGLNDAVLKALVNTNEEFTFNITANKKLQEKLIDLASRFFWHIKKDIEPQPVNSDDIKKIFPEVKIKSSYLTDIESEYAGKMIDRKKFLKKKIGKYNNEVKDINDGLMLLARDNKLLYNSEGEKLCSQVMYDKESLSIKDLPENIYKKLKEDGIIKTNQVRYIS